MAHLNKTNNASATYTTKFSDTLIQELQQDNSLLVGLAGEALPVMSADMIRYSTIGKAASGTVQQVREKNGQTPWNEGSSGVRWANSAQYHFGIPVNRQDELFANFDPQAEYFKQAVYAKKRAMDEHVLSALTGNSYAGESKTAQTLTETAIGGSGGSFSGFVGNGNYVPHDSTVYGVSGGVSGGVTMDKVIAVQNYCAENYLSGEPIYWVTKARHLNNLKKDLYFANKDWGGTGATTGMMNQIAQLNEYGITFILYEGNGLTSSGTAIEDGDSTTVDHSVVFTPSSLKFGMGGEFTRIAERPEYMFNKGIYHSWFDGGFRTDEQKVLIVENAISDHTDGVGSVA